MVDLLVVKRLKLLLLLVLADLLKPLEAAVVVVVVVVHGQSVMRARRQALRTPYPRRR
jgi:hypothetical protein